MSFQDFVTDHVSLIKADGRRWDSIKASVQTHKIFIEDGRLPIEEDDIIERSLPNGLAERYVILDRGFHNTWQGIPAHYQIAVRKETAISRGNSPSTVYNVTGPNARLNIGSVDSSTNVVNVAPTELLTQLQRTIEARVEAEQERNELLARLADLQSAQGTPTYLDRYQRFIAAAANHMTTLAPFLPALTQLMGKLG
jgi:hypothetical protein